MPKLSPGQPFGPIPATVTLDGSGNGSVPFQATGSAVRITNLFGKVSTSTNQAVVSVYVGTIADTNRVFNNNSGSTGFTAQGSIDVPDGTIIYVVWTGGDVGAVATATFSGRAIPFDEISGGFEMRADDPIAAGDGSLIFPAIKSPNYVPSVSGWKISRDGVAEFLDAIIRGTIDIAGGVVTIDNSGITVEGPDAIFTIDIVGGIRAKPKPTDGSYVALQDNAVFVNPIDPYNTHPVEPGYIAARETTAVSSFVYTEVRSPGIDGEDFGRIRIWGASDTGVSRPTFDIGSSTTPVTLIRVDNTTDLQNFDGSDRYGRGRVNLITSASTLGLTTTAVAALTFPSVTYKANRAYEVLLDAAYAGGNNPALALRKGTTTSGTLVVDGGRVPLPISSTLTVRTAMLFITGGSDVTTQLNITMASQATTNQNGPRRAIINDIGPASDYSDYSANTLT